MEYSTQVIEDLLQPFKQVIGEDYQKYSNHVSRVYLNCLLLDADKGNELKYAIAAVFHDIGIWTKHTIDYLAPSIEQAKIYLISAGKEEWIEEISSMIYWHHKLGRYTREYAITVETFRKADWIDVSLGLVVFGLNKNEVRKVSKAYPNLGFHVFLIKKISKNFLKHPFNPLPMFKG